MAPSAGPPYATLQSAHYLGVKGLKKMYQCPHCQEETIGVWQKVWADRMLPTKCSGCSGRSYVPIKYGFRVYYRTIIPAILVWALVVFIGSHWPLVSFAPLFIWSYMRHLKISPLVAK